MYVITTSTNTNHLTTSDHEFIESAIEAAKATLLLVAKRGWKVRSQNRQVIDGVEVATVVLVNAGGVAQESATVFGTEKARLYSPVHIIGGEPVRHECIEGTGVYCVRFYSVGRSLDHNYWQCFGCGARVTSLTETGANA